MTGPDKTVLSEADQKKKEIRELAESDLLAFITLVHPHRVLGAVHREVIRWWTRRGRKTHQLLLLPRDHGKSALVAYRVAWEITKNPAVRVLYISSTSNLASKQLKFIKDILTSDIYRFYWPEMVNPEEGKREKWTETEIAVDHPIRKKESVRDPTVFTAGLTTGITGLHCDIAILDDVVVKENAYTKEGRQKVAEQYSLLSSIEGADAEEWVVGTRYHPDDLYAEMLRMEVSEYDKDGNVVKSEPLYEVFERQVENRGDGTGEFLWPRQQRSDGKWFGFNSAILAKKRAQYLDKTQFRAQYYNDPTDPEGSTLDRSYFQYYDRDKALKRVDGKWYIGETRLNLIASIDFAVSKRKEADYTALVVAGMDKNSNIYVVDIRRFKTSRIKDYFKEILDTHIKWGYTKLVAEVSVFQKAIVDALKHDYIAPHGLILSVEEFRPAAKHGSKEERIEAALHPRYEAGKVFHYEGGNCQVLEDELIIPNPSHDDVKDALATCVLHLVPPAGNHHLTDTRQNKAFSYEKAGIQVNERFGGLW